MRVNIKWLRELVDLSNISTEEIVKKLSLHSIEIENVSHFLDSDTLVVGYVLTKEKHPNADQLSLLTVDVQEEVLQIVCGAPNVAAGQYVIVAKVGTTLPEDFTIKKTKIRGLESCGMVCSLQELGIAKKHIDETYLHGIYYFPEPQTIGMQASIALGLDDAIIELGLTPNRGDLLSMIGVAYECSAVFNRTLKPLTYEIINRDQTSYCDVDIKTNDCLLYYGQIICDVEIRPSPTWLISRLIAFGIRPINNCVDITNYILALYGQPLHAFDFSLLGRKIEIRKAQNKEKMTTLDGVERELESEDIVITDGVKPVAIAGVMGGADTEVTQQTKHILLEAAVFEPVSVRATSTRLGLRSESSLRFERGVDVNRTKQALEHASYLFFVLAKGNIDFCGMDGVTHLEDKVIELTTKEVASCLGITIKQNDLVKIFERLHFTVDYPMVSVPNRRSDITIKEDLIEEVVRLYGYDLLPTTYPKDNMIGALSPQQQKRRRIKSTLAHLGLCETVTYSLVSESTNQTFSLLHEPTTKPLKTLKPLSEERQCLRMGLLPSLIEVVQYNFSRKNKNLALFEIGSTYSIKGSQTVEKMRLAGVMANQFSHTLWNQLEENVDFYVVKGILDTLFSTIHLPVTYQPLSKASDQWHPHRSAEMRHKDVIIGYVGQLHPQFVQDMGIDDMYVFEIDLDYILHDITKDHLYQPMAKLPNIERDIAIVVHKSVLAGDVIAAIYAKDSTLSDVVLFDVYQGEKIDIDEKSIAIRLVFTQHEALTDEDIQQKVKHIVQGLERLYQAKLRS